MGAWGGNKAIPRQPYSRGVSQEIRGIVMSLITCTGVNLAYDGNIVAKNIDFAVEDADYLCILGENGAGKSTLIKGLLRLKKPSSGTIKLGDGLVAKEIGYLPQQTAAQKDFPASAYEAVLSGCLNSLGIKPFYTVNEKRTAERNLEQLGIAPLRNKCYRELSGGQQRRVLLARALCATKRLLLLDEPAAGLDPVATQELYELIQRINEEMGIAVIMVSHDVHAAVTYAKHILHLQCSQLFFGSATEYRASDVGRSFCEGCAYV